MRELSRGLPSHESAGVCSEKANCSGVWHVLIIPCSAENPSSQGGRKNKFSCLSLLRVLHSPLAACYNSAMTLTSPIVWIIHAYRKWLSPIKGWTCAHGQEHKRNTCSQMGLRIFSKTPNPIKGLLLLQRQFDRCADSAERLNPALLTPYGKTRKPFTHLLQHQRGDCDLGGCDGCDAGGFDLPDCGKYEMPNLSLPCSDSNPMSARSCDWSGCCDGPSCDKNNKASRTASAAQQSKFTEKREIRREKRTARRIAAHDARAERRENRKPGTNQDDSHS